MSDEDTVRVWLVYRDYNDKGLLDLYYATTDGDRVLHKMVSPVSADGVTAATDVGADRLDQVQDAATNERYAAEATRMAERHDPDEPI